MEKEPENKGLGKALFDAAAFAAGAINGSYESNIEQIADRQILNPPVAEATLGNQSQGALSGEGFRKAFVGEMAKQLDDKASELNDARDIDKDKKQDKSDALEKSKEPTLKNKSIKIEADKEMKEPTPKEKSQKSETINEIKEPTPKTEPTITTTNESKDNSQNNTNKPSYTNGYSC